MDKQANDISPSTKLWIRLLPSFLRERIEHRANLQKVAVNIWWLLFDKLLRMGVGLIVGVWTARYLGPTEFGMLNYAAAYGALFSILSTLGLEGIVIRDIVRYPERTEELLGSALLLRGIGSGLTIVLSVSSIMLVRRDDQVMLLLVLMSSLGSAFQIMDTIDYYFQSKLISKNTVIAKNSAFLIASSVKIYLLLNNSDVLGFAIVGLFEIALGSLFMGIMYKRIGKSMRKWRASWSCAKGLLLESWPLMLSGVAVILYMRMDQVMLGKMMGDKEVGIFSSAIRISEIWYFIPSAISTSIYPALIDAKKQGKEIYVKRLNQIFFWMTAFTLPVAALISISAPHIVSLLYGNEYSEAGRVLSIHIWAGVPLLIGLGYGKAYLIEGLTKLSFYFTFCNAIANISLNLMLIPKYGPEGAAAATAITQFFSFFVGTTYIIYRCDLLNLRRTTK